MRWRALAVAAAGTVLSACGGGGSSGVQDDATRPTVDQTTEGGSLTGSGTDGTEPTSTPSSTSEPVSADVTISVDIAAPGAPISPLIRGVSSTLSADELRSAGLQLNSWGGNPSTRYNFTIGHAWNHGADYEFRNTNYGDSGDSARNFLETNAAGGVASRVAVPMLGWVARDDLDSTCSFPVEGGGCLPASEVGNCADQQEVADPTTANVETTPEGVAEWVAGLLADGYDIPVISMDNEPDLWGYTHYDVHPECPTFQEILDKYLAHATAIRELAPDAQLAGPVLCCWFDYWNTGPSAPDGSEQDFLSWFLQQVKAHDEQYGQRTLDVVDVHFYPQTGVFNEDVDAETNARRLRSTRALWDPLYVDESWINDTIEFIPRMRETIERSYPDTPLMISEWNFGGDKDINGALTIAEVLGIYGREGVYAAAYWRNPEVGSPGFLAFTMHGNYDGEGTSFGGATLPAESSDVNSVSAFAALDETSGVLRVMLVNKDPEEDAAVGLDLGAFTPAAEARRFTYSPADLTRIVPDVVSTSGPVIVPAASITVLELEPAG